MKNVAVLIPSKVDSSEGEKKCNHSVTTTDHKGFKTCDICKELISEPLPSEKEKLRADVMQKFGDFVRGKINPIIQMAIFEYFWTIIENKNEEIAKLKG